MFKFTPVLPRYLDLELTSACPADCPMCPRDKLPKTGIMSEDTFGMVLEAVKNYGKIATIGLCGIGEPLLHPKLFEYIFRLKQLNKAPKISLVTGGEKLTPEVFEKLKDLKTDIVEMSLQAVDEALYQRLMPGLKFKKIMHNLDYIAENVPGWMTFSLSFTVHKLNEAHAPEVLQFAKQKGFKISVRKIHTRGGNVLNPELLDLPPANTNLSRCRVFELINFISWDGSIHICCQDAQRLYTVGNIQRDSFFDIARKKAEILAMNGLEYEICKKCDDSFRNLLN